MQTRHTRRWCLTGVALASCLLAASVGTRSAPDPTSDSGWLDVGEILEILDRVPLLESPEADEPGSDAHLCGPCRRECPPTTRSRALRCLVSHAGEEADSERVLDRLSLELLLTPHDPAALRALYDASASAGRLVEAVALADGLPSATCGGRDCTAADETFLRAVSPFMQASALLKQKLDDSNPPEELVDRFDALMRQSIEAARDLDLAYVPPAWLAPLMESYDHLPPIVKPRGFRGGILLRLGRPEAALDDLRYWLENCRFFLGRRSCLVAWGDTETQLERHGLSLFTGNEQPEDLGAFDSTVWKAGTSEQRREMVGDLLDSLVLLGKTRDRVEAILGFPDLEKSDRNGLALRYFCEPPADERVVMIRKYIPPPPPKRGPPPPPPCKSRSVLEVFFSTRGKATYTGFDTECVEVGER